MRWNLLFAGLAASWGFIAVLVAAVDLEAEALAFARLAIAAVTLAVVAVLWHGVASLRPGSRLPALVLLGVAAGVALAALLPRRQARLGRPRRADLLHGSGVHRDRGAPVPARAGLQRRARSARARCRRDRARCAGRARRRLLARGGPGGARVGAHLRRAGDRGEAAAPRSRRAGDRRVLGLPRRRHRRGARAARRGSGGAVRRRGVGDRARCSGPCSRVSRRSSTRRFCAASRRRRQACSRSSSRSPRCCWRRRCSTSSCPSVSSPVALLVLASGLAVVWLEPADVPVTEAATPVGSQQP